MNGERHQTLAGDRPFFWRVADGVVYAEMPSSAAIRPPLLSEWESTFVQRFRNTERRRQWLAGRALAKVLVREQLKMTGIVEIREGTSGEPLVYRNGLPLPDVWIGIVHRHGRVAAVFSDRPVAIDIRRIDPLAETTVSRFLRGTELRTVRKVFREVPQACSVVWAIKEAAVRALRADPGAEGLAGVQVHADFGVTVGGSRLHTLAVRMLDDCVVAIVGHPRSNEQPVTRIVGAALPDASGAGADAAARRAATSSAVPAATRALERSLVRARRIVEARARWQRLRWQT